MNFAGNNFVGRPKLKRAPAKKTQAQTEAVAPQPTASAATLRPGPNLKVCNRCGKVKPYDDYMINSMWEEEDYCDKWCKSCLSEMTSKQSMMRYCWENRRAWNQAAWEKCADDALSVLSLNAVFQGYSEKKRNSLVEKVAAEAYTKIINAKYVYEPHVKDGEDIPFDEAVRSGAAGLATDINARVFSAEFNGYFTQAEIDHMKSYMKDFDINPEDRYMVDVVKKLAKLSMMADNAINRYHNGDIEFSEAKELINQFDTLSKSSNIAASKRTQQEKEIANSFGVKIAELEESGRPCIKKVEWSKDDIDEVKEYFVNFASKFDWS